eukprot:1156752-Pelagomonas_calceolata.AAC.9
MSPQGACCLLHGLAIAGVRPPPGWLSSVSSKLAQGLARGKYSAGQLVMLLRAVARLQQHASSPPSPHQHQQLQHSQQQGQSQGGEGVAPAFAAAAMWSANRHMHRYTLHARATLPSTLHSQGTAAQHVARSRIDDGQGPEPKRARVDVAGRPPRGPAQAHSMSEHPVLSPAASSAPASLSPSAAPVLRTNSPPQHEIAARTQPGGGRLMSSAQKRRLHLLLRSPRSTSTPRALCLPPTPLSTQSDERLNQLDQQHDHYHHHSQQHHHQQQHHHRREYLLHKDPHHAPEEVQQTRQQQQRRTLLQQQQQQRQAHSHPSTSLLTPTTLAQLLHALVVSGCYCCTPSPSPEPSTSAPFPNPSLQGHPAAPTTHPAQVNTPSTSHGYLSATAADSAAAADATGAVPSALPPARWRRACAAALLTALREDAGYGVPAAALAEALTAARAMGVPHTQSRV